MSAPDTPDLVALYAERWTHSPEFWIYRVTVRAEALEYEVLLEEEIGNLPQVMRIRPVGRSCPVWAIVERASVERAAVEAVSL